jgi:peptidoglycan/LPS O-acetylase OafA/YrhL
MASGVTSPLVARAGHGTSSRILELDGLRAIAILLVLGCHYPGFAKCFYRLPEFGWIGVDIFFALSGFLITTILLGLRGRRTPYHTFYSRRFIRILPPYLAATLFLLFIAIHDHWNIRGFLTSQLLFLQAAPEETRNFFMHLIRHPHYHLTHFPALLSNAHGLPYGNAGAQMIYSDAPLTYWSLSIEEYFYLLWAPVVLRCSRRTIISIAVFVCLGEMLLRWLDGTPSAYFSLFCRFDALLYGAFVAILFERWGRRGVPQWASRFFTWIALISCAGLVVILFAVRPVLGREVRASVLFMVFGIPLISIVVSALIGLLLPLSGGTWWLARILRIRVLLFLGTISYTMYLVHIIAAATVLSVVGQMHWNFSDITVAVVSSILTILISYASWHSLEKPLLRWKDRRFPNAPHPAEPTLS